jgi:peptide/nickel transport system permease protein
MLLARAGYRLITAILTLLFTSVIVFVLINVVPGSAAVAFLGQAETPAAIAAFNHTHGLDRPLVIQYFSWLGGSLHGDFGRSFVSGVAIGPDLLARLPVTLELTLLAGLVAVVISLPLGVAAAYFHQSAKDSVVSTIGSIGASLPSFWVATMLVLVFALVLHVFPVGGYTPLWVDPGANLTDMVLPAISLGVVSSAVLLRVTRTTMIEILGSDYIRCAIAKGAPPWILLARHALRNALIPFMTVGALELSAIFGGAVIIERIFLLPGVGQAVLIAVTQRDLPMLEASVMAITLFVILGNFVVDMIASVLDPRILERAA